ncbi:hypothetical protein, partial [Brevibacillus sp. CF112]|uniref:hypothetical protein n=1 Tax=Brevibacillus sp. CF112 TaxID=1144311 RepID=UPI001ED91806
WFKAGKSLMIDSSTLSLFSFQRAFSSTNRSKATFRSYHITLCFARGFFNHFAVLSSDKI